MSCQNSSVCTSMINSDERSFTRWSEDVRQIAGALTRSKVQHSLRRRAAGS